MRDRIINEYFEWLYGIACDGRFSNKISYRKLLMHLHTVEFTFTIKRDANRACDGVNLRYKFALNQGYEDIEEEIDDYLDGPCSILEMILALAIRCEETIMDDPKVGKRTAQWFWNMINNLGLGGMYDDRFDKEIVDNILARFLKRKYKPNGEGGLFTVNDAGDLRKAEIWYQLCWYLDNIT